ncbi:unnamed protein product [Vitrella brassicaformis CCMP3155]|uniref:Matrin-type domain-containing protein n=1 Tax=Vitrella brassicaformis (strain CCMP3155) TaxID=1169540 RepID=A0A0G4H6H3_VITBC|nr:unnamed protein product [Vitrella brassicaformis CCMP3155]|mmetsp:Transcript_54092/g.136103  ORF Transcript_54092/g.136103 Transcript_54092/m.136103 type:complete len:238 (-) Transcript_54092:681-1394(-)|eukprot:CEM39470.1 unnamed protein product [Vitrella brassicaformis CCMP3155]
MDFQNRVGHKTGSGAPQSAQDAAIDRRERLKALAMETIDLKKDPYLMRNHLGTYECKLCLTLHNNEASYLAHTQGKKHQTNLARRQAKEALGATGGIMPQPKRSVKQKGIKIGRPGYKVTKVRDQETMQKALLFEVDYPEIVSDGRPRHRVMSAYEQHVEESDSNFQYLLFAAEPYETVAFKIPNLEIDRTEGKFIAHWDKDKKKYTVQIFLKKREDKPLPSLPQRPGAFLPIGARW